MNGDAGGTFAYRNQQLEEKRQKSGYALLEARGKQSTATDVLIIQHSPQYRNYVVEKFHTGGGARGANIISTFGHTHSNYVNDRDKKNILIQSGAGGGYKSDAG